MFWVILSHLHQKSPVVICSARCGLFFGCVPKFGNTRNVKQEHIYGLQNHGVANHGFLVGLQLLKKCPRDPETNSSHLQKMPSQKEGTNRLPSIHLQGLSCYIVLVRIQNNESQASYKHSYLDFPAWERISQKG